MCVLCVLHAHKTWASLLLRWSFSWLSLVLVFRDANRAVLVHGREAPFREVPESVGRVDHDLVHDRARVGFRAQPKALVDEVEDDRLPLRSFLEGAELAQRCEKVVKLFAVVGGEEDLVLRLLGPARDAWRLLFLEGRVVPAIGVGWRCGCVCRCCFWGSAQLGG